MTASAPVAIDSVDGIAPSARARGVLLGGLPARRLGLRTRITLAFGFGAMLLSIILAGSTYALVRSNLIEQRERNVLRQAYVNAANIRAQLPLIGEAALSALSSLVTPAGSSPILIQEGSATAFAAQVPADALPETLRQTVVVDDVAARMRFDRDGTTSLAVGVPIDTIEVDAAYFEVVDLSDTEDTLRTLGIALAGAGAFTTLAGFAVGWWASRRALRPLADVSVAAEAIAGGRLDTRLATTDDPDLGTLSSSFNAMAQALQERIERDARFASDVSHELRSPLMTMSAAVEVLESQRESMSERGQQAVDLVNLEIDRFRQLVEDLLEISRYDAGAVRLDLDDIRLAEFVLQAVDASGHRDVPIELDAELAGVTVRADKRRLARVIANLLDNASKYGDGATAVSLRRVDGAVQIAVEDSGPGVPADERSIIFDRFARGLTAGRRGTGEGVGLGLALVAEHVRLHGGHVWVEDRTDGAEGARFVVELAEAPS
jgi:signal transduction histidine kinase